jgi:hypothetical protein
MLHLLAARPPAAQYAGDSLRQFFRLGQTQKGLVAAGAVLGAAGLLWAGALLTQHFGLKEQIAIDQQRTRAATESYTKVTAGLPQLPTTPENLRVTMQKYATLAKQTAPPERLVGDVAAVLDVSPRIELDKLQWELTTSTRAAGGDRSTAQQAPAGASPQPGQAVSGELYELVQVEGKVLGAKASDYKGITALVNEFVERLKKRKGVEIIETKMPFALGSKESLSGDIGTDTSGAVPRFVLTVARKVGS